MVFYTENSLGSSLHNNGHAEYQIKKQLSVKGMPAGMNRRSYTLGIFCQSPALCLQEMSAVMPTKSPGRVKDGPPDTIKGYYQSDVTRSKADNLSWTWPFILGDPRGIFGSWVRSNLEFSKSEVNLI